MTFLFFGLSLILGGKLDVGRRDDLFFGLHLILGGKLDVTLSVSRVPLRQPPSCLGSTAWHGLRNTALSKRFLVLCFGMDQK